MVFVLAIIFLAWGLRALNVFLTFRFVPNLPVALPRQQGAVPFVSVIVPARNEERDIEAATESKLGDVDGSYEVVVVDDRSEDQTPEILRLLEQRFPRKLKVVSGVEPPDDWLGKPHALMQGAAACRAREPGDWLIFSDADVRFEDGLIASATAFAETHGLDFLALFPTMEAEGFFEKLMAPTVATAGFCYMPLWLVNVSRNRNLGFGGGVFNMVRRRVYDSFGGHAALRKSVVDDVQLGRLARRSGARTGFALALPFLRLRMYHGFLEAVRGFTKNAYFGLGGRLDSALLLLTLFATSELLPWVVAGSVLAGRTPFDATALLALGTVALIVALRASIHRVLGYSPPVAFLHVFWALSVTCILIRSTWINGVLGKNVWRGRERTARGLQF